MPGPPSSPQGNQRRRAGHLPQAHRPRRPGTAGPGRQTLRNIIGSQDGRPRPARGASGQARRHRGHHPQHSSPWTWSTGSGTRCPQPFLRPHLGRFGPKIQKSTLLGYFGFGCLDNHPHTGGVRNLRIEKYIFPYLTEFAYGDPAKRESESTSFTLKASYPLWRPPFWGKTRRPPPTPRGF